MSESDMNLKADTTLHFTGPQGVNYTIRLQDGRAITLTYEQLQAAVALWAAQAQP